MTEKSENDVDEKAQPQIVDDDASLPGVGNDRGAFHGAVTRSFPRQVLERELDEQVPATVVAGMATSMLRSFSR